jgi:hypothetical protein
MLGIDTSGDGRAIVDSTARNHNLRAMICHFFGNRLTNAAR